MSWFKLILVLLPKNLLSRWAGSFVGLNLPSSWVHVLICGFIRLFRVDESEAKKDLYKFTSLQDFFIRELKDGVRPIDGQSTIVSPCDGAFGQYGIIQQGQLLQVKGRSYSLSHLLGDEELAAEFEGGSYLTIYLSPRDYHRFHSPIDGRVIAATHLPGYLWPVNSWAVQNVDQLFCVNERIVIQMPSLVMVAVGATMVGKVRVLFDDDLTTNTGESESTRRYYGDQGQWFNKGQEIGRFEFGSTIILLSRLPINLTSLSVGTPVKMGQALA